MTHFMSFKLTGRENSVVYCSVIILFNKYNRFNIIEVTGSVLIFKSES